MRAFVIVCVAILVSTSFGFAGDIMANYYGNTIIAKTANSELHIHYKSDQKFDAKGHNVKGSMAYRGTWIIDNKGQLCRTYEAPPPGMSNPACTAWSSHSVGDTWSMPNVTLTLVQGIQ